MLLRRRGCLGEWSNRQPRESGLGGQTSFGDGVERQQFRWEFVQNIPDHYGAATIVEVSCQLAAYREVTRINLKPSRRQGLTLSQQPSSNPFTVKIGAQWGKQWWFFVVSRVSPPVSHIRYTDQILFLCNWWHMGAPTNSWTRTAQDHNVKT